MRCWLVHAGKESLESSVNLFICVSLIIFGLQEGVHWKTLIVCADTVFVIIRIPVDAKTRSVAGFHSAKTAAPLPFQVHGDA